LANLPAHLYKPLEEKIPEGNTITQSVSFLEEHDFDPKIFKDIPAIKDILVPQALFPDFELSTDDCLFQTNGTSKGVVKHARVIFFSPDDLDNNSCFFVVENNGSKFIRKKYVILINFFKFRNA
jgi:hypothetical protein